MGREKLTEAVNHFLSLFKNQRVIKTPKEGEMAFILWIVLFVVLGYFEVPQVISFWVLLVAAPFAVAITMSGEDEHLIFSAISRLIKAIKNHFHKKEKK